MYLINQPFASFEENKNCFHKCDFHNFYHCATQFSIIWLYLPNDHTYAMLYNLDNDGYLLSGRDWGTVSFFFKNIIILIFSEKMYKMQEKSKIFHDVRKDFI